MSDTTPLRQSLREWMKAQTNKRAHRNKGGFAKLADGNGSDNLERKKRENLALLYWSEIVGEAMAQAVQAYRVENGVLFVCTESSTWAQELGFLKPIIIKQLNQRLGANTITDIQCRIGTLQRQQRLQARDPRIPPSQDLQQIQLPRAKQQRINDMVANIPDVELRNILKRIITNEMKANLWRKRHGFKRCPKCGVMHATPHKLCPVCWAHSTRIRL